jgi:hypothetical protein
MKASLIKITKILSLTMALFLAACGQSENTTSMNVAGGGGNSGSVGGSNNCSTSTSTQGQIYDPNYRTNPTAFRVAVGNFVSATLDPKYLGDVSGDPSSKTGIKFSGSFSFAATGQINLSATSVQIDINDSLVGTTDSSGKLITAYPVDFSQAAAGNYDKSNGTFQVTFQDQYGQLVFNGKVSGQTAQGTVTFANTSAVDGLGARSGTLGTFVISSCSLLK